MVQSFQLENETYATIEPVYQNCPLTGQPRFIGVEWYGDPSAKAKVRAHIFIHFKEYFPWQYEIIEEQPFYVVICRTDTPMPNYAYYRLERDVLAIVHFTQDIGRRIVLTAMVWGLAYVPDHELPSWKHFGRKRSKKNLPD